MKANDQNEKLADQNSKTIEEEQRTYYSPRQS